ncbi:hypothetical protein ACFL3S_06460, partial [Gemmatimonadota bacterium]
NLLFEMPGVGWLSQRAKGRWGFALRFAPAMRPNPRVGTGQDALGISRAQFERAQGGINGPPRGYEEQRGAEPWDE